LRRLRILVLLHPDRLPPDSLKGLDEQEVHNIRTEFEIVNTLRHSGHDVRPLGVQHELKPIADEIQAWQPHVAFNLLEEFHGQTAYDQNVASFLELLRIPYTGCNPRGLMLARGKDLSKQLLAYHRIPVPQFAVFPMSRKVRRPPRLGFPLIVKSLSEDASRGIAQASVVDNDDKLAERVAFIHERIGTAVIAEQYIDGRELYVGVLGNERHRPRARGAPVPGVAGTHTPHGQAHLPHPPARRLQPHRPQTLRRQRALFPRGQPQPRSGSARGTRRGGPL
jgi:D-alanine-D-alanine ligase